MRDRYSYQWASERVKNVLGLAFAVPKKTEGDNLGDAPEESIMRSGDKVSPHLMRQWTKPRE